MLVSARARSPLVGQAVFRAIHRIPAEHGVDAPLRLPHEQAPDTPSHKILLPFVLLVRSSEAER